MKVFDHRVIDEPFSMIKEGECFFWQDVLYIKIPLCFRPEILPDSLLGTPFASSYSKRNCMIISEKMPRQLDFRFDDDMVIPVNAKITVTNYEVY